MHVEEITFVRGATSWRGLPTDGRPEVAFVGRSNVGKSSLLNALAGRRGLARISRNPGKTREFNHYLVNRSLYFVDLPGLGYAKVSKQQRDRWSRFIERYVRERKSLQLLIHLIDGRHPPTNLDHRVMQLIRGSNVPYAVVLAKCDKLSGNDRTKAEHRVHEVLSMCGLEAPVFPVSSQRKQGLSPLLEWIGAIVQS